MQWQKLETAPKDGTNVLLASVDDDGIFGIRQGFYEKSPPGWYDIDGEEIEPQFWSPIDPLPPGAMRL